MKKFLTTLAVLAVVATPAFAQSFDPDNGTGNVLRYSPKSGPSEGKFAVRQDAMRAYAAAPFGGSMDGLYAPSATGGGSAGYNEMLRNY